MEDWKNIKGELKAKRLQKGEEKKVLKGIEKDILEKKFITVQQLTEHTYGVKQKYNRIGARQFVSYNFDTLSLEKIKIACESQIDHSPDKHCDILASEQGPSCTLLCQIPKLNLIHIRFIDKSESSEFNSISSHHLSEAQHDVESSLKKSKFSTVSSFSTLPSQKRRKPNEESASLTVSKMLNAGCLVETTAEKINLFSFNVKQATWTSMDDGYFIVAESEFATGGFRKCFKATSATRHYEGRIWVIKKFHDRAKSYFSDTSAFGFSEEGQSKKTAQMHQLAKNIADQFREKIHNKSKEISFFQYKPLYYGLLHKDNDTAEHVTIEEYIEGDFIKFINNTGDINTDIEETDMKRQKAEALAHFSYVYSEKMLLLTDIQGIGYWLIDPEIASMQESSSVNDERLFTAGNLFSTTIDTFFSQHNCNIYCQILQLDEKK